MNVCHVTAVRNPHSKHDVVWTDAMRYAVPRLVPCGQEADGVHSKGCGLFAYALWYCSSGIVVLSVEDHSDCKASSIGVQEDV